MVLHEINQAEMGALREQVVHGTPAFPVGWYPHLRSYWQEYYFIPHWHRELELIVVESGQMELVIQGQSFLLHSGMVLLIPPNVLHTAYRLPEKDCCFSCIVFAPEFIAGMAQETIRQELLEPLFVSEFHEDLLITSQVADVLGLSEAVHQLLEALDQKEQAVQQLRVKGLLLLILATLFEQKGGISPNNKLSQKLQQDREKIILGYMADHLAEKITLAELASQLNLSKEQFSRFFRQAFRRSPLQYVTQMRLQKACRLLLQGDLTMSEVAEACGFDNSNYFARVFKQHFAMSPTDFQKK